MNTSARLASDKLTIAPLTIAVKGQRAHCSDVATHHYWTSEHPAERARAALACHGCPVGRECGEAAEANDERWGVWNAVDRSVRIVIRCSGYWASAGGPCEEDSDSWCRDWWCGLRVIPVPDSRGSRGRSMEDDTLSTGELAGRQGYTGRHGQSGEPDVLLDVPQLSVEEIILEVEDLRARVSLEANVLNLLRLSIGADVQLGRVHLDIKGLEAQALLKVRLDTIAEIINRVLTTIDSNPEIIAQIISPLGAAASELTRTAGRSVDEVVGAVGSAVPELSRTAGRSVDEVVGAVGSAAPAAPDLNRSVDEDDRRTRRGGRPNTQTSKPGRPKTQP
jgi:hypothetical protein